MFGVSTFDNGDTWCRHIYGSEAEAGSGYVTPVNRIRLPRPQTSRQLGRSDDASPCHEINSSVLASSLTLKRYQTEDAMLEDVRGQTEAIFGGDVVQMKHKVSWRRC